MNTTVLTVKIDPKLKHQAQKVADHLGFTLSALVKGYFKELVRSREVAFSLEEIPSPILVRAIQQAEKDREQGWVSPVFTTAQEAIAWLDNPNKKYVRHLQSNIRKK